VRFTKWATTQQAVTSDSQSLQNTIKTSLNNNSTPYVRLTSLRVYKQEKLIQGEFYKQLKYKNPQHTPACVFTRENQVAGVA